MDYRKRIRALEMVWRGSGSLEDAEIFTGNFISGAPCCAAPWPLGVCVLLSRLGGLFWEWGAQAGQGVVSACHRPALPPLLRSCAAA